MEDSTCGIHVTSQDPCPYCAEWYEELAKLIKNSEPTVTRASPYGKITKASTRKKMAANGRKGARKSAGNAYPKGE